MTTIQALRSSLTAFIWAQIDLALTYFDPIKDPIVISRSKGPSNRFIFPLFLYTIGTLWGLYGLGESFQLREIFTATYYTTNRFIYYHQVFPRRSWKVARTLSLLTNITIIATLAWFTWKPKMSQNYEMFLASTTSGSTTTRIAPQDRILSIADSRLIARNRRHIRIAVLGTFLFFYIYYQIFSVINVRRNETFRWTANLIIHWFGIITINSFYYIFFTFCMPLYAIQVARCLQIRQHSLLKRLKRLNHAIKKNNSTSSFQQWTAFTTINGQINELAVEIKAFDHFWSPYISITFTSYIVKICYEAFVTIFYGKYMSWSSLVLFLLYPLYYSIIMFAYIAPCETVDWQNKQIIAENRRFYWQFQKTPQRMLTWRLLKSQCLLNSEHLRHYAFTLFVDYRITSNTFEALISVVSAFFLITIKDMR